MSLRPGQSVRLILNPARVGILTDRTRTMVGQLYLGVQFPTGFDYIPEDQLEPADEALDPHDLLKKGTLSSARDLTRVLTHARLSGHLADYLYSLETTRTIFFPHQFKPVLKLLTSVGDGILIADEVGLGKTIEAGLIWTELRTRFEYRRLVVVCPAVLRDKWRQELSGKFGVRAELCDASDACDRLREAAQNPLGESFALIGSMQGLRPRGEEPTSPSSANPTQRLAKFIAEREGEEPLIDLLVIDEAHHLRNSDTATSRLGFMLRACSSHVVLLTATPVNLRSEDLFSLVRLLDPETFAGIGEFHDIISANGPLVEARRKIVERGVTRDEFIGLIDQARRHPILQGSKVLEAMMQMPPSDEDLASPRVRADLAHQLDQANLLGQVVNRTRRREIPEQRIERKAAAQSVEMTPLEADFYDRVTGIVREFCRDRKASEGFLLTTPQRQMASSIPAAFRYWQRKLKLGEPNLLEDIEDEDDEAVREKPADAEKPMGDLLQLIVSRVHGLGSFESLKAGDSKYRLLLQALKTLFAEVPHSKVVLFSGFRATLAYLDERLREDGIATITMTGDTLDKSVVIDSFRAHASGMVLLSSEVGSEGVDLQFSRVIINYDLPWNPMRVEQRIGRLDRIGQTAKTVTIWNVFCAGTVDERIYERLYERLGIFEHAIGGLEPILGGQARELTWELLGDTLSREAEERAIDAAAQAIELQRKSEEELESNASQFFALGDYLLEQVKAAQQLGRRITDLDLRNYVIGFLRSHHSDFRMETVEGDQLRVGLWLSPEARLALEQFMREAKISLPTRLTSFSATPVPCRFRNVTVDAQARGTETINQFHPLVRYARDTLKKKEANLQLAVAAQLRGESLANAAVTQGQYVFAVERWTIKGVQVSEKLAYAAANLETGAMLDEDTAELLVNTASASGCEWPSAASMVDFNRVADGPATGCLLQLADRYEKHARTARLQNQDRADALIRTLQRQVEGQVSRIERVIEAQIARGQTGLVAANRARIQKLRDGAEKRRLRYVRDAQTEAEKALFLMGLISVEP